MKYPRPRLISSLLVVLSFGLSGITSLVGTPPTEGKPGAGPKKPHHEARVIVKFKKDAPEGSKAALHSKAGTKPHKKFDKLHGIEVRQIPPGKRVDETLAIYEQSDLVEYAEPDYVVKTNVVPNDPYFTNGSLWQHNNTGQSGGRADADMDSPEGWNVRTGTTAIVAVIDSGVRYTHEDLAANMWRNPREIAGNLKDDDGNGYVDDVYGINTINGSGNPSDNNGHGTHVAGIIAAVGNNAKGVTGVAWNAKIMACKFLDADGSGYTSDAIEAVNYARLNGAKVLNNSWGGGGYSRALFDAFASCRNAGILVVVAAGNDASNNDVTPDYPSGYALDNLIAVAATTRTDTLATYSNYGAETVEVAAPGHQIVSTYHTSNTAYMQMGGTSMAAPQVSGLVALLAGHFPAETYGQILTRTLDSVDRLTALTNATRTGGRINLAKALVKPVPGNDLFEKAELLAGDSVTGSTSTVGGSKQPGEPAHAGNPGGASVWWKWVAPRSGGVMATTAGSNFNTLLAVYTGSTVGALTPVASNDNLGTATTSALSFVAVTGTTYYFAVDGYNGATGSAVLKVTGPPSGETNNAFANRTPVSGTSFAVTGSNRLANKEAGEPNHAGNAGGKSVWWTWTAPSTGYFYVSTSSSNFDTLLAVYTGTSVQALTRVASNDDYGSSLQSQVLIYATQGRAYQIAVDGYSGEAGDIRLSARRP